MRGCVWAVCFVLLMLYPCATFAKGIYQKAENCDCKMYNPNPQSGEKVFWDGKCNNGFAEGVGTQRWESVKNGKKYWSEVDCTLSKMAPIHLKGMHDPIIIRVFGGRSSFGDNYKCSGPKGPASRYANDIYECNGKYMFGDGSYFDGEFQIEIKCSYYNETFGGYTFHNKLEGKLVTPDKKVTMVSKNKEKRDRENAKMTPSNANVRSSEIIGRKKTSSKGWTYDVRCVYNNGNTARAGVDEYEGRYSWHNPWCQKNSVMPTKFAGTLQQAVHNACNCLPNN